MSMLQTAARVFGVIFIIFAVLGFVSPGGMDMAMEPNLEQKMGFFSANLLHNSALLLSGIWGLVASRGWSGSKSFFIVAGIVYGILTVVGILTPTGFDFVPHGEVDILLHGTLAVMMLMIGLTAKPDGGGAAV